MHVGGPILPGTLTIVALGVSATDRGGLLMVSANEVGQVDYDNGIVRLSTDVWGAGTNTFTVTFTPAVAPDLISDQQAIRVTAESRSLNYALVINPPLPRTLTVSYLAQGRWYVLRDAGDGVLAGINSAFGVGTINYTTGGLQVTLGALPDVGSSILLQSYTDQTTVAASNSLLLNSGKLYAPLNTSGQLSEERGSKRIEIGSLSIGWSNGTVKLAQDDGLGNLTGDATGSVDYTAGVVLISPNTLPPVGTVFLMDSTSSVAQTASVDLSLGDIGQTDIIPGSVSFLVRLTVRHSIYGGNVVNYMLGASGLPRDARVIDNGLGGLMMTDPGSGTPVNVGTIDYVAGILSIDTTPPVGLADSSGPLLFSRGGYYSVLSWNRAQLPGVNRVRTAVISVVSSSAVTYSSNLPGPESVSIPVTQYLARTLMVPNYALRGVGFSLGSSVYSQRIDNTLVTDVNPTTGVGTPVGVVIPALGVVALAYWNTGDPPVLGSWRGLIAPPSAGVVAPFFAFSTVFRTASSPLRPGSVSVLGTTQDGTSFNVTADIGGKIDGTRVKGRVDYQFGLVELHFVNPDGDPTLNVDLSHLQIPGLTSLPQDLVSLNTLRYNAVAFSYLPLDAELLGIDPVRLPSDGRVPIFRPGGFAVVGHTGEITGTVENGQTINCARVRLSRVRVIGFNGAVINTGFTTNLELGTVTFTNVSGYSQPVTVQHRIEDMGVVRDVQISGEVTFTRAITHNYPLGSYLSSALIAGDLFARTSVVFDQATWAGVFEDTPIGNSATATYNNAQYPIVVTNRGAIAERWALRFTNTNAFDVIGENVGVIATGNTVTALAPINPATGASYFTLDPLGWGAGWVAGNVLRINTVGAQFPVWVVRTVQQGPETVTDDKFTLLIRGDVDTF
jgi:hypothetical protein